MLYILSGLPGTGKTTLARALAKATGALHLRIDAIEVALASSHRAVDPLEDAGYAAAMAVARGALAQGIDVIADSVNPVALTRDPWRACARDQSVPYAEIELTCTDTATHRSRVETRAPDLPGQKLPRWADVLARQYDPWARPVLRVDTSAATPEATVDRILDALGKSRPTV